VGEGGLQVCLDLYNETIDKTLMDGTTRWPGPSPPFKGKETAFLLCSVN
jgi:hypothetical protein